MLNQYDKLKVFSGKCSRLDQSDLDFGIYRIMNAKREEIESFLIKSFAAGLRLNLQNTAALRLRKRKRA